MINIDDVIGMTDLTSEEIEAIAEHEHITPANAAMLAEYLMHEHHGEAKVHDMICDDIREALHKKDLAHARELYSTLKHYIETHPGAVHGVS
ncbi:MAG: hypothetical protein ACPGNV_12900 [Mangrovicoccus sp.]